MIGAVLAGGLGRRLAASTPPGLAKAALPLAGRPLFSYPAAALAPVCERVALVCKPDTALGPIGGLERWDEPDEPRHPLTGIISALERAGGPVLVCAADMAWVTAESCRTLAEAAARRPDRRAAVAAAGAMLQPVFGVYRPEALAPLRAVPPDAPLRATVAGLDPLRVALAPELLRSVNTPEDLAAAERSRPGG